MSAMREVHSRMASDTASFSVAVPVFTGTTSAPKRRIRYTLRAWRTVSFLPHKDHALHPHEGGGSGGSHPVLPRPRLGDQAGLAHPLGQKACPSTLLILWAPVWFRSSRFR